MRNSGLDERKALVRYYAFPMASGRKSAGLTALCLVFLFSGLTAVEAQVGSKILRRGNVEAVKKMAKAAVLTDEEMRQLSLQTVQHLDAENPVAKGDVYSERLNRLVAGLEREDGLNLNFAVYLVAEVNAFATPDGSIRIFAGLMNLMTDDELRAVIGHEIGHVKLKHSKKQYQKAYSVSAGRDAAAANTGSASFLAEEELGQFVEEVLNAKFSRSDEAASDKYGFAFMLEHGYEYHAMETAFLKLGALAGSEAARSLKTTHPAPSERAGEAKKRADAEDKKRAAAAESSPVEGDAPAEAASEPAPEDVAEPPAEPKPEPPPE